MPNTSNGNVGAIFPTWTTATRSASAQTGETGYNTTTNSLEIYTGSFWFTHLPSGLVIAYAAILPPNGFLICNGATISRTVYAGLFNAIGTTFGIGDGSTTFAIPDYRGAFVRGYDPTQSRDPSSVFGVYEADIFASHNHSANLTAIGGTGSSGGDGNFVYNYYPSTSTGSTGGSETRPKNIPIQYVIKY